MPNIIAYIALLTWPFIVYAMFRKMSPERAFIWAILGGYMLLPQGTEFNISMVPALDKVSIPNLTAAIMCVILLRMRPDLLPENRLARLLLIMMVAAPVVSVFNNTDAITFGTATYGQLTVVLQDTPPRPGMRIYDSISTLFQQLILALPFFIARTLLATETALKEVLRALVVAGLVYSVPMLWEVRFSPQLHVMVYGFFQHDFGQMMRDGGFRPIVFMPHGLWIAFFAVMTAIAALHMAMQAAPMERLRAIAITVYLFVVVYFCRSLGPMLILLTLAPLIVFTSHMMQLRVAASMGVLALLYPIMRGIGLVPTQALVDGLERSRPERAESLEYRFNNEDILLERASEKLLFGWGGWGRNQVFDPMTGEMLTISDGQWIITIGQFGWFGYLGTFGLLVIPLFALWACYRQTPNPQIPPQVPVLALLLGANTIDLLPNATLIPFTWLLAGALLGHTESQTARDRALRVDKLQNRATRDALLGTARPKPANLGARQGQM